MADSKPKLTDVHRDFLVRELACYSTPKEVADLLKETYGVTITPQSVEYYDPAKPAGKKGKPLSKKWADRHAAYRKAFLTDIEQHVPTANKSVRVREYDKLYRRAKARGNDVLAASHLEHIAKEVGNVHTNRREHTGRDGKPLQFEDVTLRTEDELRASVAARLERLGVIDPDPTPKPH